MASVRQVRVSTQPQMVESPPQPLVKNRAQTFGGGLVSGLDMFSTEKAGINRPCPRPDHGSGASQRCQDDRNPRVIDVSHSDPNFDYCNQSSYNWCPEANEEKYAAATRNDLRSDR